MKREDYIDKMKANNASIEEMRKAIAELEKDNVELWRKAIVIDSEHQQYIEEYETFGRGKNKSTHLIGRVHWNEYFLDEDTGEKIRVPRSSVIKKDGEWTAGN